MPNKGYTQTKEHRKKISEAQPWVWTKERREKLRVAHLGKKLSVETKLKMSEKKRLDKHQCWLGGKKFGEYGIEFCDKLKNKIRKRDNYTCQKCNTHQNKLDEKLSIHHIDYNKKNNKDDNLISLCRSCHAKTNFDRNASMIYYQKLIKHK